jgi:formimidoylglutamate deiminase
LKTIQLAGILTKEGQFKKARISVNAAGKITAIDGNDKGSYEEDWPYYVIPGFTNNHSHAFQFAMAGLAEHLPMGQTQDDFWLWRNLMYNLALTIKPEEMKAIAEYLYHRMLAFGITAVCEFHYLHNDTDGKSYNRPVEMSLAIMEAAHNAGIHLTMIPVYYHNGDFDQPAFPGQRRFLFESPDKYLELVETLKNERDSRFPDMIIGQGIHSLRAASQTDAKLLLKAPGDMPIHLHIAEQTKEVDQCLKSWGKRPVEWLLDNVDLSRAHSLVHSTHMSDTETDRLAKTGAQVVLCPTTEGNLGDGIFPLRRFIRAGGAFTLGTDSHVGFNMFEELRWLDYVQRLAARKRNVACFDSEDDSGEILFRTAWFSGQSSLGTPRADYFEVGQDFDGILLDPQHPGLYARHGERVLSSVIYQSDHTMIKGTITKGRLMAKSFEHLNDLEVSAEYRKVIDSWGRNALSQTPG